MLDLHCHILPGIDDGATDLDMALQMARIAADDGIHTIACTPHIYPGMYDNNADGIRAAIAAFQAELDHRGIPLLLVEGADVHLDLDLVGGIRAGRVPTLARSRYLLLEPPHHVAPPRFEDTIFQLMLAGYVPVITHPERLSWIEDHYGLFVRLAGRGAWMQVTAGALTGRFGRRVQYWAERFVGEGHCQVLATDAHHPQRRPPLLAEAREAAAVLVGRQAAEHMVVTRPAGVIADADCWDCWWPGLEKFSLTARPPDAIMLAVLIAVLVPLAHSLVDYPLRTLAVAILFALVLAHLSYAPPPNQKHGRRDVLT